MKKSAAISVIVTTYNSERFISQAIESVLSQSKYPEELIVVDNGSTDATEGLVKNHRIPFYAQTQGQVGESRNLGMRIAKSPLIKFLDADDLLDPKALEILENAYYSSRAELIYGKTLNFIDSKYVAGGEKFFAHSEAPIYSMSVLSSLITRDVFLKYGFPDQDNYSWNRWLVNAQTKGIMLHRIDQIVGSRRIHDLNISHSQLAKNEIFNLVALKMKNTEK
jgi:glycosyltransferase involved in cell wall biosynthesis